MSPLFCHKLLIINFKNSPPLSSKCTPGTCHPNLAYRPQRLYVLRTLIFQSPVWNTFAQAIGGGCRSPWNKDSGADGY